MLSQCEELCAKLIVIVDNDEFNKFGVPDVC